MAATVSTLQHLHGSLGFGGHPQKGYALLALHPVIGASRLEPSIPRLSPDAFDPFEGLFQMAIATTFVG
jgi:hypothetical protein